MAKNITPKERDIDAMARVAYAETGILNDRRAIQATVDNILNRVAEGQWGDTFTEVINDPAEYEPVTNTPNKTWTELRPAPPSVVQAVREHLAYRAAGGPSTIGHTMYFGNPNIVDDRAARGIASQNTIDNYAHMREPGNHVLAIGNPRGNYHIYGDYSDEDRAPYYTVSLEGQPASATLNSGTIAFSPEANQALESLSLPPIPEPRPEIEVAPLPPAGPPAPPTPIDWGAIEPAITDALGNLFGAQPQPQQAAPYIGMPQAGRPPMPSPTFIEEGTPDQPPAWDALSPSPSMDPYEALLLQVEQKQALVPMPTADGGLAYVSMDQVPPEALAQMDLPQRAPLPQPRPPAAGVPVAPPASPVALPSPEDVQEFLRNLPTAVPVAPPAPPLPGVTPPVYGGLASAPPAAPPAGVPQPGWLTERLGPGQITDMLQAEPAPPAPPPAPAEAPGGFVSSAASAPAPTPSYAEALAPYSQSPYLPMPQASAPPSPPAATASFPARPETPGMAPTVPPGGLPVPSPGFVPDGRFPAARPEPVAGVDYAAPAARPEPVAGTDYPAPTPRPVATPETASATPSYSVGLLAPPDATTLPNVTPEPVVSPEALEQARQDALDRDDPSVLSPVTQGSITDGMIHPNIAPGENQFRDEGVPVPQWDDFGFQEASLPPQTYASAIPPGSLASLNSYTGAPVGITAPGTQVADITTPQAGWMSDRFGPGQFSDTLNAASPSIPTFNEQASGFGEYAPPSGIPVVGSSSTSAATEPLERKDPFTDTIIPTLVGAATVMPGFNMPFSLPPSPPVSQAQSLEAQAAAADKLASAPINMQPYRTATQQPASAPVAQPATRPTLAQRVASQPPAAGIAPIPQSRPSGLQVSPQRQGPNFTNSRGIPTSSSSVDVYGAPPSPPRSNSTPFGPTYGPGAGQMATGTQLVRNPYPGQIEQRQYSYDPRDPYRGGASPASVGLGGRTDSSFSTGIGVGSFR
jgi:hypothetical protein